MGFKDAPWDQRLMVMGDRSEAVYEEVMQRGSHGFVRYGLRRPPIRVDMLPARIRYTPDYLTSRTLDEVMSVGKDQIVKVKVNKLITLHQWHVDMPTHVWLWDSYQGRYMTMRLDHFTTQVTELGDIDQFPEGTTYWGVNVKKLEVPWHDDSS